jgi:hypothetical protein
MKFDKPWVVVVFIYKFVAISDLYITIVNRVLSSVPRKKLVKCYIWRLALYGVETLTLGAVDQKHVENFEMRC